MASGSVATTDNEAGTQDNKKKGLFSDVRPGMLFTYNSPRHIHELLAEVDFLYNINVERPQVTFRGGYKAYFVTGPRSEMSVDADAAYGEVSALQTSAAPGQSPTQVIPSGRTDTQSITSNENGSYQATKGTRVFQRIFARYTGTHSETPTATMMVSDVDTSSTETGVGIGLDHRRKSWGLQWDIGATFVHLERIDPDGIQMGSRVDNQLNPRSVLVWQYDISQNWSKAPDAGAEYVHPVTQPLGQDPNRPKQPSP